MLKSQLKLLEFNFDRIFAELNPEKLSINKELLSELEINMLGNTKEEGVVIAGKDYNYRILRNNGLLFELIDNKLNEVIQTFAFDSEKDGYFQKGNLSEALSEDNVSELIDFIDSKLVLLKRKLSPKIPKPYIPDKNASEKIAELNKKLRVGPKKEAIKDFGLLDEREKEAVDSILDRLDYLKELYQTIPGNATKYNIRSYYKNYVIPKPGQKTLTFKDIGPMGEPISFYQMSFKNQKYIDISVIDFKDEEINYIISLKDGTVQRNLPYKNGKSNRCAKRRNTAPDYYTREELENSNFYKYLCCFDRELKLFTEHVENWLKIQDDYITYHSNIDVGSLEVFSGVIDDIKKHFDQYKFKLNKYLPVTSDKIVFKEANNIDIGLASKSVIFKKMTMEGHDIKLSFPKIIDKTACQILILDGDKVVKSFYIIDNKLLKFDIKDKNDTFVHSNRNMYFHTKEYVQQANLGKYLCLLHKKLKSVNRKLDSIKRKANSK